MQMRYPSAGTPINWKDIFHGFQATIGLQNKFSEVLSKYLGMPYCFMVNSGTTAFYIILKTLSQLQERTEVVLPAYTAPSLILPIKKAGLEAVLCDVDCETFMFDYRQLEKVINKNTLCVVPVHSFGLACDIPRVFEIVKDSGALIIEDVASALGTRFYGYPLGSLGDINIFSFNRGKNISTGTGGAITTRWPKYAELIALELKNLSVTLSNIFFNMLKVLALSFAVKPTIYSIFYDFISRFKYTQLHTDFEMVRYTRFQCGVGVSLFRRIEEINEKRYENGMLLYKQLQNLRGVILPRILPRSYTVFNQFPVLIEDAEKRAHLQRRLMEAGIEATLLYPEPIHAIYRVKNSKADEDAFPQATFISKHLLLIPTHPMMPERLLQTAVAIFQEEFTRASTFVTISENPIASHVAV